MTISRTASLGASGLLMIVALATPGCATKKYVRQQVGPVDQRVSEVDKKHSEALANLEGKEQKDVSRVEERAMGAENRANEAARAAQAADQKATQAGDAARNATDLAQQTQSRISDVSRAVENIDNFKLVSSENVLFGFNKANLTQADKSSLDSILQQTQGAGRYIVEVEGFTDRTGPRDYNLALSRRRADAVVRYMVDKGVPLRRIHMIGLGSETPSMAQMQGPAGTESRQMQGTAQQGTTEMAGDKRSGRAARKEMRRVTVNIYAPETTLSASSAAPQSQMNQPQTAPQPAMQQTQPETPAQTPPSPR